MLSMILDQFWKNERKAVYVSLDTCSEIKIKVLSVNIIDATGERKGGRNGEGV